MTIPTPEELGTIFRDACDAASYGEAYEVYPEQWASGAIAVRDAVLEGAALEAERWPRPNPDPLEFYVSAGGTSGADACADDVTANFLRSLKGGQP